MLLFIILTNFSCIEPIEVGRDKYIGQLVVEGEISNLPGPYKISLRYNAVFPENPDAYTLEKKITDAIVMIFEAETGESSSLAHVGNGVYETTDTNFEGVIGNTYHLEIQHDEKTFQSRPSKIMPVPEIDSIYSDYDSLSEELVVYLDFTDFQSTGNKYRWEWEGYKKILTSLPGPPDYPDTFDCCVECYVHDRGKSIITYQDSYTNGNQIQRQKIMNIPLDNSTDYLVEIKQMGLTIEEYNFLHLLKTQIESKGGLFDPLPYNLEGNVYNINDPTELALGYFSTVSIVEKYIQVERKPYFPFPNIISQTDCRTIPKSSDEIPENWNQ